MSQRPFVLLGLMLLAACSTLQLPAERLERSDANLRAAEAEGARDIPRAQLLLQMARDQTRSALALAGRGDPRALLLLARAEADGELALALARGANARVDAAQAEDELLGERNGAPP